jgi:AAA+ ATPase superfamily predicted ATPase
MALIGRKKEQRELERLLTSGKAEFLALYGRRRVGKTWLIKEYFNNQFTFYATGVPCMGYRAQLSNFAEALADYGATEPPQLTDWLDAFRKLRQLIEEKVSKEKKVIFIDEMPWFDTPRSKFVPALEYFWNNFAAARADILLIACGSAASWMTEKVLRNQGGLHNRVTMRMNIAPFTLQECEQYYNENGIVMNRYQMVESYMILGGVPYYLSLMDSRKGFAENVDDLFFGKGALLDGEYHVLYRSLFDNSDIHHKIVENLSKKTKGLTRFEIEKAAKTSTGGGLTKALTELELSGFIRKYSAFSKKVRGALYQLIDPYTLFYFNFIQRNNDEHFWQKYSITPGHNAWSGYAFEMVCLHHIGQIKSRIGAGNVLANVWSWKSEQSKPGAQIDLVIDRGDGIISLCEMKFLNADFQIDAIYDKILRNKRSVFLAETKTKKALHTVLITTYGMIRNEHSASIQSLVCMDDLFLPEDRV